MNAPSRSRLAGKATPEPITPSPQGRREQNPPSRPYVDAYRPGNPLLGRQRRPHRGRSRHRLHPQPSPGPQHDFQLQAPGGDLGAADTFAGP